MGKLLDPERMRKAKREREERAKRIFAAARVAFSRDPYSEVTLDRVGQAAGAKQGQASLAFRSREELFLAVMRAELEGWYDHLESELGSGPEQITNAEAAALVAATLDGRPELTRMLAALPVSLELHEDGIEVHRFHSWHRERLLAVADAVAERLPGCHRWDAFDALYRAQLIAAAVHPVSRPVGNLAVDLVADDHQVFALDLEEEVRRVVLDSLRG
jgi:AcrR family transcriptional regulator